MLLRKVLLLFLAQAVLGHDCKAPAPSCAAVLGSPVLQAYCSDQLSSSRKTPATCTVSTTISAVTTTIYTTKTSTTTLSFTDIATRLVTKSDKNGVVTAYTVLRPTTVSVIETTTTTTDTVRETSVVVSTVQTTAVATFNQGPSQPTNYICLATKFKKNRKRRATPLPSDCSCFLTSTASKTVTPKVIRTTSTVYENAVKSTTKTVVGATSTVIIPGSTTTVTSVERFTSYAVVSVTTGTASTFTDTQVSFITETSFVTTTVSTGPLSTPDISCNNAGLRYDIYDSPFLFTDDWASSFDPEFFKYTQPFIGNKLTDKIGITGGEILANKIHDNQIVAPHSASLIVVNYRGYLYAPTTGTYKFYFVGVDDILILWIGGCAIEGFNRQNKDRESVKMDGTVIQNIYLEGGIYHPIQLMYANGGGNQGYGAYKLTVQDPANRNIVAQGYATKHLVSHSCDGSAPPLGQINPNSKK